MAYSQTHTVTLRVNGLRVTRTVTARTHLADLLREQLDLTGPHLGCEHGVCGACTVLVNDLPVRGCLMLAVQADGAAVQTVEGLTDSGIIADLQDAFVRRNALQCGYCTPGMLVTLADLLQRDAAPTREVIREAISGNYCRCTGYHAIVDAVEAVVAARQS
jgi:carbon-monoxide dehydrogenase small subunit